MRSIWHNLTSPSLGWTSHIQWRWRILAWLEMFSIRSTTVFRITGKLNYLSNGWPLRVCRHKNSPPNQTWYVGLRLISLFVVDLQYRTKVFTPNYLFYILCLLFGLFVMNYHKAYLWEWIKRDTCFFIISKTIVDIYCMFIPPFLAFADITFTSVTQ